MIEILMATYNGEGYLREQLDSIINQKNAEFTLTIRDDGSTDGTVNIVKQYMQENENLIKFIWDGEATGSAKENFIRLLQQATGDYIMFADQDDVWDEDKTANTLAYMRKLEKKYGEDVPLLVHTDLRVVDEKLNEIAPSFLDLMKLPKKKGLNDLLIQNSVVGCSVMINRRLADMAKKLQPGAPILMHDQFLAITAAAYGHLGFVDKTTVSYRQHSGNQIGASEYTHKVSMLRRLKNGRERFREDMEKSYLQVQYMLDLYGKDLGKPDYNGLICGYAGLVSASGAEKRKFYRKYNVYKKSFVKKMIQILWT